MNPFSRPRTIGFFALVLWCTLVCLQSTWAADPGSFANGNAKYAAGDFTGAAKDYENQIKSGDLSANLFYNLGDAYYRAGDRGRAVLNYRRALSLDPAHTEAAGNLAFVNGGKTSAVRSDGNKPLWNAVAVGAAVCGWLGVAGLLVAWMNQRLRTLGTTLAVGGILLCAAGVGAIRFLSGNNAGTRAIVLNEGTPALYSPVEGAKIVTTLPLGGEVRLLSEQGAWSYVLLPDGNARAWLPSRTVEPLVPR